MLVPTVVATAPLNAPDAFAFRRRNVFDELERQAIVQALALSAGNISKAADRLGIYRQTLQRKMKKLGLR